MNRNRIIAEIESLKDQAIVKGFDYPVNSEISNETTTRSLKRFLGDIKHFLNNEEEYNIRHKKE